MAKIFRDLFPQNRAIIGMIHLAGRNKSEKLKRALEELAIYVEGGVHGAIIEDYFGEVRADKEDIENVLRSFGRVRGFTLGINLLRDPYSSFEIADEFGAEFVQFDSVLANRLNFTRYNLQRKNHPKIAVFGGVRFKYQPSTRRSIDEDINEGLQRCEAIVTTGDGTGEETPLDKLRDFRRLMGNYPLIVGAGVNAKNVYVQLVTCDGAIVGTYFKNGDTSGESKVDRERVKNLMDIVKQFN